MTVIVVNQGTVLFAQLQCSHCILPYSLSKAFVEQVIYYIESSQLPFIYVLSIKSRLRSYYESMSAFLSMLLPDTRRFSPT